MRLLGRGFAVKFSNSHRPRRMRHNSLILLRRANGYLCNRLRAETSSRRPCHKVVRGRIGDRGDTRHYCGWCVGSVLKGVVVLVHNAFPMKTIDPRDPDEHASYVSRRIYCCTELTFARPSLCRCHEYIELHNEAVFCAAYPLSWLGSLSGYDQEECQEGYLHRRRLEHRLRGASIPLDPSDPTRSFHIWMGSKIRTEKGVHWHCIEDIMIQAALNLHIYTCIWPGP